MSFASGEYELFRNFLERGSGIVLGDNKQYLVASRLRRIMAETEVPSLAELVRRIDGSRSTPLREAVIDAMTTNETLWFRDLHPFNILRDQILPVSFGLDELKHGASAASAISSRPLRIWSAACSTGQEPYSIAMTLDQFRQRYRADRIGARIVATDLSSRVLDTAREGIYEQLALGRGLDKKMLEEYFVDQGKGCWQINQKLRSMVEFKPLNLLESFSSLGQFDIIFCRNVLIYFSGDVKTEIIKRMHAALRPGGFLMLGASESPGLMSSSFNMLRYNPGIAYQRI